MTRCSLLVACCLLTSVVATAQVNAAPPQTEQSEIGIAHLPGRPHTPYRIRLLPVSSFPQLPPLVAQQLEQRGCMIPQTYEARGPENVIHGSFEKKGSSDWAALCSVNGMSTLYVFFQSDLANPIPLRHQADTAWLGVEWSLDYGSAWGIGTRRASLIQPKGGADHDGIDDSFVEKSTTVHYFENGNWTMRDAGQ